MDEAMRSMVNQPGSNGGRARSRLVAVGRRYLFSLHAELRQRLEVEIGGGYQLDLDFAAGRESVRLRDAQGRGSDLADDTQRALAGATLASGSDWLLLGRGGVVTFASRLTLRIGGDGDDDPFFLPGHLRGRAHLGRACQPDGTPLFAADEGSRRTDDLLGAWEQGFPEGTSLPLLLAVELDVPFAGDHPRLAAACRPLEREPLLGFGRILFGAGRPSRMTALALDVHTLDEVTQGAPS
jgi:hypothetical protein